MAHCPICGGPVSDQGFCPTCNTLLREDAAVGPRQQGFRIEDIQQYWDRPGGIELVAIGEVIGGLTTVGSLAAIPFLASMLPSFNLAPGYFVNIPLALTMGSLSLLLGWGLWNGRSWAWTWSVALTAFGLVAAALQLSPYLAIDALLLYYFYRPNVRGYFRKLPGQ
ncbi:MAG TPA: hypothetical protein VMS77_00430 [Conexivisphaerales archaeon]|nr:hypothetical protein [Conexivisphaerales archaeon]